MLTAQSSLFAGWPGRTTPDLSSAKPDLLRGNLGVALEQETFSGLPDHPAKRLLAPSPIDLGAIREFSLGTLRWGKLQMFLRGRPPKWTKTTELLHIVIPPPPKIEIPSKSPKWGSPKKNFPEFPWPGFSVEIFLEA